MSRLSPQSQFGEIGQVGSQALVITLQNIIKWFGRT